MPQQEQFADLTFPERGIDLSQPFGGQLPLTTADALNVRTYEPTSLRRRGGQRSGLEKYLPEQLPPGAVKVQLVDVIVDPQGGALPDLDDGDFLDPSDAGPARLWGLHFHTRSPRRKIRRGGTGRVRFKNRKVTLDVFPIDITKGRGDLYTFAGTEFETGPLELDVLDSLDTVTLSSPGAAAAAAPGTYTITSGNPVTGTGLSNYNLSFHTGTLTVSPTRFIQATSSQATVFTNPYNLAYVQPVTAGHLLVLFVAQDRAATLGVTDSLGNVWLSAGVGQLGGLRLACFFAISAFTGACTVHYANTAGGNYGGAVLEYSGPIGLDTAMPGNGTYHTSPTDFTTQSIPVGGADRVVIGAFSRNDFDLSPLLFTPGPGFITRVSLPNAALGEALYIQDKIGASAAVTATGTVGLPGDSYVDFGISFQ